MLTAARILAPSRVTFSSVVLAEHRNLCFPSFSRSAYLCQSHLALACARRTAALKQVHASNADKTESIPSEDDHRVQDTIQQHAASAPKRARQLSEETRRKMSASKQGGQRSAETRRKISESMRGITRTPETKRKMSVAQKGRSPSLGTRYVLHRKAAERQHSEETRSKIRQRMKEVHAARKAAKMRKVMSATNADSVARSPPEAGSRRAPPGLVMEKAVAELMQLRQDIANFMSDYTQEHGIKPALEDAETTSPQLYAKFVRFVALQDFVRNFEEGLG